MFPPSCDNRKIEANLMQTKTSRTIVAGFCFDQLGAKPANLIKKFVSRLNAAAKVALGRGN
jgi:hypothetical protein